MGVFMWTPQFLRDWGYACFAASRFTLFGETEYCKFPSPDVRGSCCLYALVVVVVVVAAAAAVVAVVVVVVVVVCFCFVVVVCSTSNPWCARSNSVTTSPQRVSLIGPLFRTRMMWSQAAEAP